MIISHYLITKTHILIDMLMGESIKLLKTNFGYEKESDILETKQFSAKKENIPKYPKMHCQCNDVIDVC